MRPVNLIPQEDRRGGKAPLRTGPLPYAIVAILVLALGAVTLLVLTGNKIADRKAEAASLTSQVDATQAHQHDRERSDGSVVQHLELDRGRRRRDRAVA